MPQFHFGSKFRSNHTSRSHSTPPAKTAAIAEDGAEEAARSEDSGTPSTSPSSATRGAVYRGPGSPSGLAQPRRSVLAPRRSLLVQAGSVATLPKANNAALASAGYHTPESGGYQTPEKMSDRSSDGPAPTLSCASAPYRILLVRHAQSANKNRAEGQAASADPGLTDLGHEQAEALGRKLAAEFRADLLLKGNADSSALIVSSPMRRCLLTIRPAVNLLKLGPDSVFCHGACFEYGCAGTVHAGSSAADVVEEFPEFSPVGFRDDGMWDYQGSSPKEIEAECRQRVLRIGDWLRTQAPNLLRRHASERGLPTLILVIHQTLSDALCRLLIDGSVEEWEYLDIAYKTSNACLTELFLQPGRLATLGLPNDSLHLSHLRPKNRTQALNKFATTGF
mmetsp:Transcript_88239/g.156224  ORF Transcript_88239/g.156224 Transcript_88239/m.156224 type:complete len:394 (+) Transcript_88239:126-1307(+)